MKQSLPRTLKYFVASLILAGVAGAFLLADTSNAPKPPGSQSDQVSVHLEGSILAITVYDASVITKLRRVVGGTSELSDMVRIVTRQSGPEGWGTVLSAGHLPGSWQDDNGYFESCYVVLNESSDVWEGDIEIFPTPSLDMLYVCKQGWYEDTMTLGIAFNEIPDADASTAASSYPEGSTLVVSSTAD
ncbi:MAG: hypothetical protein V3T03_07740, partial [Candidatus Bipolaricaulota bacterium]